MNNNFLKTIENTIKHWYIPALVGIIFIAVGIYTLISPLESYLALALVFSISFLFSGSTEIFFAFSNRKKIDNWVWSLTLGIITFIFGVLLILNTAISLTTLPFYVGFLILFRSIAGISYAIDLKKYGKSNWGNLMFMGFFGILFSFFLIWNPLFAGMTIVFWTGLALISSGIYSISLSIKLQKMNHLHTNISDELKNRYKEIQQEIHNELNQN